MADNGGQNKSKKLILTCDTEAFQSLAPADHVDRLIWGKVPHAPYPAGIGLMMDIADQYQAKISFFLDVMEITAYGTQIDRVAHAIIERGHDLQLHLHTEFIPENFWHQLGYLEPTWAMNQYNEQAAQLVLEYALDHFVRMTGFHPCAYRAGAFRYNQYILMALKALEIPLSFQYYPFTALKDAYPHGIDAGPLPVFHWSNGIIEIPVSCVETPHPRKGLARYRGFELHRLMNLQDALTYMNRFWTLGPEYEVMVLVMHSWSFLSKDESGFYDWKHPHFVNLFRQLLENLPADVQVVSAWELQQEFEQGIISSVMEMPLCVAGTEGLPLYQRPSPQPAIPNQEKS